MAGYTRQDTGNNIANGNVIDADDFDAEYNALEAGFNASTGHKHDGSSGEGAPITKVGPTQNLVVSSTTVLPKTTNTLDVGSAGAKFKNAFFTGGVNAATVTATGNVSVGGNLSVTGNTTIAGNLTFGDAATDTVDFNADVNSNILPEVTGTFSLGTSTQQWQNLWLDGTANVDTLTVDENATVAGTLGITGVTTATGGVVGNVTGNLTGNVTGDITGDVTGDVTGNITGNVTGNVTGNLTGGLVGGVTGDLTGDVTGDLTGDVTGNVTGDVTGNVTGNLTGNVTGDVTGNVTGNTAGVHTGNVTGNLTGNVTGDVTGAVTGNASTATALATARSITLSGDVTGTASFNGTSDITIAATVPTQVLAISDVVGLQTEIDTKAELAGSSSQAFSASTLNATTVDLGNWTVTESSGTLYFATSGTNKMKLDANGNLTVTGDVNTNGTI